MLLTPAHINQNRLKRDGYFYILFLNKKKKSGRTYVPRVFVRASTLVPKLFKGPDSVGGQLRGDKECPLSGVRNQFW